MTRALRLLFLLLMAATALAADLRYNGVKPDFIVDVRSAEEYAGGHIDGAINVPVERIGQDLQATKGLHKDSTILVYCRSGRRSAMAAETLLRQGYTHVLDGGAIDALARMLKQ